MRLHPARTTLTVLSIVIGVAAVVSVASATSSTRNAYRKMFASVTGNASFEVVAAGEPLFSQDLQAKVAAVSGVKAAVPVFQQPTVLYPGDAKEGVRAVLMGVDVAKHKEVLEYKVLQGKSLESDEGALVDKQLATSLGLKPGDMISFLDKLRDSPQLPVAGIYTASNGATSPMGGVVFLPIDIVQTLYQKEGRISLIQVVLNPEADEAKVEAAIAAVLPTGITVRKPVARTSLVDETLFSSEQGLRLSTGFSLLMAVFIILNTFLMSVGERRQQLAIMRAVGSTERQIAGLLYAEAMILGAIGTALGIPLGLLGARFLTQALGKILQVELPPPAITSLPLFLAVLFGLGVSLLGAIMPARRAAQLSPMEALRTVSQNDLEGSSKRSIILGWCLICISSVILFFLLRGELPNYLAPPNAVSILLGIVLVIPLLIGPLSAVAVAVLRPLLGVEAKLAHRQVLRHRSRSVLTVGVLFVAASTGMGMASTVLDSVRDVRNWYEQSFQEDFFIRAMMPDMSTGLGADLPTEIAQEIKQVPGIKAVDTARFVSGEVKHGDTPVGVVFIVRDYVDGAARFFDLEGDQVADVSKKMAAGEVVIGTVLSQRIGVKPGQKITLETAQGPKEATVAALTNEYMVGGLAVYLDRKVGKELLNIEGTDAFIIRTTPGERLQVKEQLQKIADSHGVLLYSFDEVRKMIEGMIIGIEGCLWGVIVLGFVIATFGVVNTLTMNVLEQTREIGLLRVVAMTRSQVRKTIFAQAALVGLLGLLPGTLAGIIVSYINHLASMPATGHPVPFGFHPVMLSCSFVIGFLLVVLAAWFPAERAARLELVTSLRTT